jgi:peptide/nickel transport system substrate-binding protein
MSDYTRYLSRQVTRARMSRREFMGRMAAAGVTVAAANSLFMSAARAQAPQKGESTNSLDPATFLTQVPQNFGNCWGEQLVLQSPEDGSPQPVLAESWEPSEDAAEWRFKIRSGVTFHNGQEMTPEDVAQTIRRHSDEATQSAAAGVLSDIDEIVVDGDHVVFRLARGNADLPLLLTDYHLIIQPNGGYDEPDAGIGTGPYRVEVNEPGVRHVGVKYDGYWRDEVGHERQYGAHVGAAVGPGAHHQSRRAAHGGTAWPRRRRRHRERAFERALHLPDVLQHRAVRQS